MKIIYYEGDKIHSSCRSFLPEIKVDEDIDWSFEVGKDSYSGCYIKIYAQKKSNDDSGEVTGKVDMVDFTIGKKFVQSLLPRSEKTSSK